MTKLLLLALITGTSLSFGLAGEHEYSKAEIKAVLDSPKSYFNFISSIKVTGQDEKGRNIYEVKSGFPQGNYCQLVTVQSSENPSTEKVTSIVVSASKAEICVN